MAGPAVPGVWPGGPLPSVSMTVCGTQLGRDSERQLGRRGLLVGGKATRDPCWHTDKL